jgi:hypothetical protein
MKRELFQWIFEKYSNKKFHENSSNCSAPTDGRTDTQIDEGFRNAPNEKSSFVRVYSNPSSNAGL